MSSIVILLPNFRGGGAERVNLDLAHGLAKQGHQIEFVLLCAEGVFLEEAAAAFNVVDLKVKHTRQALLPLARYLRQKRPDALIASMWPLTTCAAFASALARQGTRVLLVEHGTLSRQYRDWGLLHDLLLRSSLALGCRLADAVASVSRGAAEDLAKQAFFPPERVHVLHNPIPQRSLPATAAMADMQALWPATGGPKIITVGSFKREKNHALLLQAFALLPGEINARLMILGEGALRPDMEAQARALGIDGRLAMPGFFTDPTPFYASADLFVLSSNYEGFGNVIVEALACGKPVVSTDCPSGPREILADGQFGRLVSVGDAHALASAMVETLQATHDPDALKARAQEFSVEKAVGRYLELLA